MATPNFTPSAGAGTTWTDPQTGTNWVFEFNPFTSSYQWRNLSSSNVIQAGKVGTSSDVGNTTTNVANNNLTLDQVVKAFQDALAQPAKQNTIKLTPEDLKVPTYEETIAEQNKLIARAYEELKPYYIQILKDADGDLSRATARLKDDYDRGVRIISEDVTRKTSQFQEDLNATLASLGITFGQEKESLLDTLNKRGIALTQNQPGEYGNVGYATGGQPQTELSRLSESQKLRKEAEERTARRGIEEIGIESVRKKEEAALTKTRGEEDWTRGRQAYGTDVQKQLETEAAERGRQYLALQQAQKAADLQSKIYSQQYGGSSGSSGGEYPSNWGSWMSQKGIREYDPTIESYARSSGQSYETAAYDLWNQGKVGRK